MEPVALYCIKTSEQVHLEQGKIFMRLPSRVTEHFQF